MTTIAEIEKIQSLSQEELEKLINISSNTSHMLEHLGIRCADMSRKLIINQVKKYGLKVPYTTRTLYSIDELKNAVPTADCFSDICRILSVTVCTYNITRLQELCIKHAISTEHFKTHNTKCYKERNKVKYNNDLTTVLEENSTFNRSSLRGFLVRSGLYTGKCSLCGIGDYWNNKTLTLEVDHINGNHTDNRIQNLRWVCPNCHSQTPTFKKGTVGQTDNHKDVDMLELYKQVLSAQQNTNNAKEEIRQKRLEQRRLQEQQKEEKRAKSKIQTNAPQRGKVNWDDVDVAALVAEHKNYEKVGRMLGVTGAAVKRQLLKNHE